MTQLVGGFEVRDLFSSSDYAKAFGEALREAIRTAGTFDEDVVNWDVQELATKFVEAKFGGFPALRREAIVASSESYPGVVESVIKFHIPFDGSSVFFEYRPSAWTPNPPIWGN